MPVDRKAFIELPGTPALLQRLDRIVRSRSVGTLVGPQSAGKSRLLDYWKNGGSTIVRAHEVLLVDIWRPERASLGDSKIATPIACITFSQLWDALDSPMLRSPLNHKSVHRWRPERLYTDYQFLSLFRHVHATLRRQQVRAIIIDNAGYLDRYTLERLMALRDRHHPQSALILCAQMRPNEAPDEPLDGLLYSVAEANVGCTDKLVLSLITVEEFSDVLANLIKKNLYADVRPNELGELLFVRWGERVQGNWQHLDRVATLLDEELGPEVGQARRVLNQAVYEKVEARLSW